MTNHRERSGQLERPESAGPRESQRRAHDEAPPTRTVPTAQSVAVACESTCCLPPALAAQWGIGIIPIPFVFGEQTFLDGVDITPAQFYARLAAAPAPPKTSPPSPGEYLRLWQRLTERADSVVMVTPTGRLTTFGRSTRLACELAPEALPGKRVVVVDSGSAGMGQGFVALAAARAAHAGQPLDAVVCAAEAVARRMRLLVTLDTLDYLARASRIPQVAAFVGGVLAIKPILLLADGEIRQLARVRTRRRSIAQLIEQMRAQVPEGTPVHVAVQHTQAEAEARALEAALARAFNCADLTTTEFTPVMGAYCGPGLLGIAFYMDEGAGEGEA
jgi:DegV family protein with EDD domain